MMDSIEKQMLEIYKDGNDYIKELIAENTRYSKAKIKTIKDLFEKPRIKLDWGSGKLRNIEIRVYSGKLQQIKDAKTIEDLKMLLMQPKVHYDGCKIVPDNPWILPEEELIAWSNTSMLAPLSREGFDRYMEVLKEVFPNETAQIMKI